MRAGSDQIDAAKSDKIMRVAPLGIIVERPETRLAEAKQAGNVGAESKAVNLVVSTVSEAENLLDYFDLCKTQGRSTNVLYAIPFPPSQAARLSRLARKLGPGGVSVLIDHSAQIQSFQAFTKVTGFKIGVFVKVDTGYHRAGLAPESLEFKQLMALIQESSDFQGHAELQGFYSHASHSYGGDSAIVAMNILREEIRGLVKAADVYKSMSNDTRRLTLSVGATPTATSVQNIINESGASLPAEEITVMESLRRDIQHANTEYILELHAGVYPFLDLQQVATQASPSAAGTAMKPQLSVNDIALTVLAEVVSVYKERQGPESLVAAGTLALGREPCKSYSGWGVVSDWGMVSAAKGSHSGWQVGRISQEHGILTESSSSGIHAPDLSVGQKVRIWPNHACIAGAGYGWFLVVDSSLPENRRNEIVDVWPRWRGW
ncbi:MAG: hypothetical protein LQ342_006119 [Letrouitia transgressa]|nr:MAG: hypothetical protein LQ342_006119 [Letrouitia transgressa]